mmetsp:Transcript_78535/g.202238  ORF Transcript_78535/g.202238 Transcript_78535/m.202238 type:complete len:353 (-) Transcript_78535:116-1174(-)
MSVHVRHCHQLHCPQVAMRSPFSSLCRQLSQLPLAGQSVSKTSWPFGHVQSCTAAGPLFRTTVATLSARTHFLPISVCTQSEPGCRTNPFRFFSSETTSTTAPSSHSPFELLQTLTVSPAMKVLRSSKVPAAGGIGICGFSTATGAATSGRRRPQQRLQQRPQQHPKQDTEQLAQMQQPRTRKQMVKGRFLLFKRSRIHASTLVEKHVSPRQPVGRLPAARSSPKRTRSAGGGAPPWTVRSSPLLTPFARLPPMPRPQRRPPSVTFAWLWVQSSASPCVCEKRALVTWVHWFGVLLASTNAVPKRPQRTSSPPLVDHCSTNEYILLMLQIRPPKLTLSLLSKTQPLSSGAWK